MAQAVRWPTLGLAQQIATIAKAARLHPSAPCCSGWKARLGGHGLNALVWELHRRGLVRAEEQTSATGWHNLFFTNLRC